MIRRSAHLRLRNGMLSRREAGAPRGGVRMERPRVETSPFRPGHPALVEEAPRLILLR